MRRRGTPIGLIGLIIILIAFIAWYGWTTQIAPTLESTRSDSPTQSQPQEQQPITPPSPEEVKAQLERNQAAAQAKPEPAPEKPQQPAPKPELPKPDPRRDVMEYWWEQAPPPTVEQPTKR